MIEAGTVVEEGTHSDLLAAGGYYAECIRSRKSKRSCRRFSTSGLMSML